jgi:DNA transformation protein
VKLEAMRDPASAGRLVEIGVAHPAAVRATGAVWAYRFLGARFGRRVTASFLYAMEGALRDCDRRELTQEARRRLRAAANT